MVILNSPLPDIAAKPFIIITIINLFRHLLIFYQTTKVLPTISIVNSHFFHFENVLGIENEISIFNVLTTFLHYFSQYEASDNLTPLCQKCLS